MIYSDLRQLFVSCHAHEVVELLDNMVDIFDSINYITYMEPLEVAFQGSVENGDSAVIDSVYVTGRKLMISLAQNFGVVVNDEIPNSDLVSLLRFLTTIEKHEDLDGILTILDSLHTPQEVLMELIDVYGGGVSVSNLTCDIFEVSDALLAKLRELIVDKKLSHIDMVEDKSKIIKEYRSVKVAIPIIGSVWTDRFGSNPEVVGLELSKYIDMYKHEVFDKIDIPEQGPIPEQLAESVANDLVLIYTLSDQGFQGLSKTLSTVISGLTTDYRLSTSIIKYIELVKGRVNNDKARTIP